MSHLQSPEVITFGETMGLFLPSSGNSIEHSDQFRKTFGGAESNVAIGLARLGHRAGWFGYLGDDPFGTYIYKSLRGEGIDVSRSRLLKEAPTGLMFRDSEYDQVSVYYYRNTSAARLIQPEDLDEEYIKQARILHVTGITLALSESSRETVFAAVKIAKKHGVKVCFDPNLRLKLWDLETARRIIMEMAAQSDYFLPGLDELKLLFPDDAERNILRRLEKLPCVTVLKGEGESYLLEDGKRQTIMWYKVNRVVDPIGAGDGFCAGFLAGLLRDHSHEDAIRLGNLIGSLVVQGEGDWEALPKATYVQRILDGQKHIER